MEQSRMINKKLALAIAGFLFALLSISLTSAYPYYGGYYGGYDYGRDHFEAKSFSYTQSRGYGEHVYYMKTTGLSRIFTEGFSDDGSYHKTTVYVKTTVEKPGYNYVEGYFGYGPSPVYKYTYPRNEYYFRY